MDSDVLGFVLYLFVLSLPSSLFCWTVAILALGFPRDPDDRSRLFRLVARVGAIPDDTAGRLLFAAIGLGLMNAAQFMFLLRPTPGVLSVAIYTYFLVHGICLALVAWDGFHPRSRDSRNGPSV